MWLRQIATAIQYKQMLEFVYKGHQRIGEPYLLYKAGTGHIVLAFWQTAGGSSTGTIQDWKNFDMDQIQSLTMLNQLFQPRPSYNPNHYKNVITCI